MDLYPFLRVEVHETFSKINCCSCDIISLASGFAINAAEINSTDLVIIIQTLTI